MRIRTERSIPLRGLVSRLGRGKKKPDPARAAPLQGGGGAGLGATNWVHTPSAHLPYELSLLVVCRRFRGSKKQKTWAPVFLFYFFFPPPFSPPLPLPYFFFSLIRKKKKKKKLLPEPHHTPPRSNFPLENAPEGAGTCRTGLCPLSAAGPPVSAAA